MIGKVLTIQYFFHYRLLNKNIVQSGIAIVILLESTVSTALIIMIKKIFISFFFAGEFSASDRFLRKENFIYEIQLQ